MNIEGQVKCPVHNVVMIKKRILWGMPVEPIKKDVILGGCDMPKNAPKYGYICPTENETYYFLEGRLEKISFD
jgi:hypothetical protein